MKTTSMFAEILIVGIQSSVWLGLAFYPILKNQWCNIVQLPGQAYLLLSVIILGILYSIGIIIERLGGIFIPLDFVTKIIRKNRCLSSKIKIIDINRVNLHFKEGSLGQFLEFTLGRIRIVRAAIVNVFIICVVTGYLTIRGNIVLFNGLGSIVIIIVCVLLLFFLMGITLIRLMLTYELFLERASQLLEGCTKVTDTERIP